MSSGSPSRLPVIYGIEDRPPFPRSVILALQHVLTMFGATVSVPLLFGPAMGMSQEQIALLISSVMVCSGIATLLQSTFGSRLPIIQGVSFSFIGVFFAIISSVRSEGGGPHEMMQSIAGAIIAGAVVEAAVGFSGLMGWLRRFLSPVVIGPVIMVIGLALFQHGAPKAGTDWAISGLTIALITLFALVLSRRSRVFQMFPILLAVIVVMALCYGLSVAGVYGPKHPAHVNLVAFRSSEWVRTDLRSFVFPWGTPQFSLGFFIAILAAYVASMIESFGDYHSCSYMAGGGDPTSQQISRGIGWEGVGCLFTGILGGFSSTSYSENIGLIGLTKVGSRSVVQLAGVMLIGLGFFGKFGALAAAIPGPVVGGLYCSLFGLIAAVGVQQFSKCDLSSNRNLYIAGLSVFMGLSVPAYFNAIGSIESLQPGQTLAVYQPTAEPLLESLPPQVSRIVFSVGTTGMGVAAMIGLLLDNLIPGTPEERGLAVVKDTK
jgi:uracil-xanthine permease